MNWEFPFPDVATQFIPPELYFRDGPRSPSMLTYVVVKLFYISLYFIYCKVASSTQALSHVEGLKCNVMSQVLQRLGKKLGKGNMEAFIMEASLSGGKDCISRHHAEKAWGNDNSKTCWNWMIQLADPDVIFGLDCS